MSQPSIVVNLEPGALVGLRGRHYLDDQDYSVEELHLLLDLALAIKAVRRRKRLTDFLPAATLAMIFQEPSTRTRVSFEGAMTELGGHAQYLRPGEIHLPGRESVKDTAAVLSRLCDAIEARTHTAEVIRELAEWATVPVVNGMAGTWNHPVQSMTDMLTIREHVGGFEGLKLAFIGHGLSDPMTRSECVTATRMGIDVALACPADDPASPENEAIIAQNCSESGATFVRTDDPTEAVQNADVVYTCLWWWMESEEEKRRLIEYYSPYQVNAALWEHTKPGARFMHCLPAIRGQEVTDEIIDAPFSIVLDEAENRKHFQKALLLAVIGIDELPDDPDLAKIGRALLA